jgi:uncharacterized membrane protein (UPF0127 family)
VTARSASRCAAPILAALLTAGCPTDEPPPADEFTPAIRFESAPARVITDTDTFHLTVDIAERDDQRAYGLMERTELGENEGMIFLYAEEQSPDAGFWMYRTRIPLDIAFYHEGGRIVRILRMDPCPHVDWRRCPTYPPGVPYYGALEVNRGWFAERGITEGARIELDR